MYLQAYWKNYVIDNSLQYMFILYLNLNTEIVTQNSINVQLTLEKNPTIYCAKESNLFFKNYIFVLLSVLCILRTL